MDVVRKTQIPRRQLLWTAGAAAILRGQTLPKASGVAVGDVVLGRAIVWARASGPARMVVRWKTADRSGEANQLVGPHCLETTDFTGRVELTGLPAGQRVSYEVQFEDLSNRRTLGPPTTGFFRTAPGDGRNVRFVFSGDTVGQGWGINPNWGGMRIYETMRRREPDFFIHSGDTIYADNPVPAEVKLPDGTWWRNLVSEDKSKVAETLDEFRGAYRYNLLDQNLLAFQREVPQVWQWDDHELANNWAPGKDFYSNDRYKEKNLPLLVARATKAFLDYAPMRFSSEETERVYRKIPYGPLLDVFVLDMRSYRGPNTYNRQAAESPETTFLAKPQIDWFLEGLRQSRAVWKVVAADMPIGLLVGDGKDEQGRPRWEAIANGDGPVLGRELEIARILQFIKTNNIENVVWVTADVHYCAAHYFDPAKAQFTNFKPFWEFVAGPLNAGTFGPGVLDNTFGPKVVFQKAPPKGQSNLPPSAGYQFFGEANIDAKTRVLEMGLRDVNNNLLFTERLTPEGA